MRSGSQVFFIDAGKVPDVSCRNDDPGIIVTVGDMNDSARATFFFDTSADATTFAANLFREVSRLEVKDEAGEFAEKQTVGAA